MWQPARRPRAVHNVDSDSWKDYLEKQSHNTAPARASSRWRAIKCSERRAMAGKYATQQRIAAVAHVVPFVMEKFVLSGSIFSLLAVEPTIDNYGLAARIKLRVRPIR